MKRRDFVKTVGASTAGAAAVIGGAGTAMAGSLSWESHSGYSYLKFTPGEGSSGNPLVLALHGCTQEPDDFAEAIEVGYWGDQYGYNVVFPNQNDFANWADCWNWYYDSNCDRGSGSGDDLHDLWAHEQSNLNAGDGYILGFSAGAYFASSLIPNYADDFEAAAVHSGGEYDAADSSWSATSTMASGGPNPYDQAQAAYNQMQGYGITDTIPTIVFQGTADYTVEPPNGKQAAIQAATTDYYVTGGGVDYSLNQADHSTGSSAGHTYDRYQFTDGSGNVHADLFRVDDLGHDWAGGASSRYYTDSDAPEATDYIFDFFGDW